MALYMMGDSKVFDINNFTLIGAQKSHNLIFSFHYFAENGIDSVALLSHNTLQWSAILGLIYFL